jgi:hypothetical protein
MLLSNPQTQQASGSQPTLRLRGHWDQLKILTVYRFDLIFFVTNLRIKNEPIINTPTAYEV